MLLSLSFFITGATASITCHADFDRSGDVGFSDLIKFSQSYGKKAGDLGFPPMLDTDNSGAIDFADLLALSREYGKTCSSEDKPFKILNNIAWKDVSVPGPIGYGDKSVDDPSIFNGKVMIFSHDCLWPGNYPNYDYTQGDETKIRACVHTIKDSDARYGVFDTESFQIDIRSVSKDLATSELKKLQQLIDWAKDESAKYKPEVKIFWGHYGEFPLRDYWAPVNYNLCKSGGVPDATCRVSEGYDKWVEANAFIMPFVQNVDIVYADIYSFYSDNSNNRVYFRENVDQANRLGKPVIPYVWDEFHNCCGLAGVHIQGAYWKTILNDALATTAGLVMWSDLEYFSQVKEQEFYKETVSFVKNNRALGKIPLAPRPPVVITNVPR